MHEYRARVLWHRDGATFTDNRYSRRHLWSFDGGVDVPASASPSVVPLPLSAPDAVDPEEALVAATSSCHMLWFLSLAAKRGFVVDGYVDEPVGVMAPVAAGGRLAFTRITLRPAIEFADGKVPTPADVEALHRAAHEECFVANSLKADVVVESR